ncbi:MAG: sugar ABC transporter permease [Oscillospiraceae bacterium]|jgi:D-xylose transport system permease protein|nr:sugar ABC transporter permease [Oscillospiraceae bacterium]
MAGKIAKPHTADSAAKPKPDLHRYMMIIALAVIWIVFTALTNGTYFTPRNLTNLFRQAVFTAILATGIISVILLGYIDLSVASTAVLAGGVVGIMTTGGGLPLWLAIICALACGVLVGLWNGFWIAYQNVPAFIATMASMLVVRAMLLGITSGVTISPMPDALKVIGFDFLPAPIGYALAVIAAATALFFQWNDRKKKQALGLPVKPVGQEIARSVITVAIIAAFMAVMAQYRGIPNALIIIIVLSVVFLYIQNSTVFGRRIYAIGGNSKACQLAGINIRRTTLAVYAISGLLAAVAGIFLSARLNSASSTLADGAEMDAIAACVIGGTSMAGGIGTIGGAMIGAVVIQSIQTGMNVLNTPSFWQNIVKGLVLLVAVWFDISRKKK